MTTDSGKYWKFVWSIRWISKIPKARTHSTKKMDIELLCSSSAEPLPGNTGSVRGATVELAFVEFATSVTFVAAEEDSVVTEDSFLSVTGIVVLFVELAMLVVFSRSLLFVDGIFEFLDTTATSGGFEEVLIAAFIGIPLLMFSVTVVAFVILDGTVGFILGLALVTSPETFVVIFALGRLTSPSLASDT